MSRSGLFLKETLRRPGEVVALAPSSRAVARRMTAGLERVSGPIIEIGPGTGSFTREILARGVPPSRLTLMEINIQFCASLKTQFPGVRVVNRPAQDIHALGLHNVGAVISGVPVLARPKIQRDVVGRALDVMAKDGIFVQITYSLRAPISTAMQAELGIRADYRGMVLANLPPAHVYVFRRIQH